jgi:hypothetical protein
MHVWYVNSTGPLCMEYMLTLISLPCQCHHPSIRSDLRRSWCELAAHLIPDVSTNRYFRWCTSILATTFDEIWATTNLHHQFDWQSRLQYWLCEEQDLWNNGCLSSAAVVLYISAKRNR